MRYARSVYNIAMIKSFNHKGLERFFTKGSKAGIQANHAAKLRMQLTALHTAVDIDDMRLLGGDYILSQVEEKIHGQYGLMETGASPLFLKMAMPIL